ncbi:MAG TPA: hypothetical protein DCM08_09425 [Microscillaceae bacterium]|jgi:serine/threonine-protein kinase|nr:hypothetical protein [Microscillaceae bacterium]
MIGEQILNYQIETLLFQLPEGDVFVARHLQLDRKVWVKAIRKDLVQDNAALVKQQMGELMQWPQHIRLATLYDFLETDEHYLCIAELGEAIPLEQYLKGFGGAITEKQAYPMLLQITEAFLTLNQQGAVFGHFGPQQVFVLPNGDIKLTEAGFGQVFPFRNLVFTAATAPELLSINQPTTETAIYALGVVFFKMLTGKLPYDAEPSSEALKKAIAQKEIPPLQDYNSLISEKAQFILKNTTQKSPQARFKNLAELVSAIEQSEGSFVAQKATKATRDTFAEPPLAKTGTWLTYALYGLGGITLLVLAYFLLTQVRFGSEEKNDTANNNKIKYDPIEDKKAEEEKKEEKKKKKTKEEEKMDSLKKEKEKYEKLIKEIKDDREKEVMKGLVIDGQLVDKELGEFVVQLTLVNKRKDARFEDLMVTLTYLDDKGGEVQKYDHNCGILNESKTNVVEVKRAVDAAKFKYVLKSVNIVDQNPPEVPDSLTKKVEDLTKAEKKLKEEMEKKEKEKKEKDKEKAEKEGSKTKAK